MRTGQKREERRLPRPHGCWDKHWGLSYDGCDTSFPAPGLWLAQRDAQAIRLHNGVHVLGDPEGVAQECGCAQELDAPVAWEKGYEQRWEVDPGDR